MRHSDHIAGPHTVLRARGRAAYGAAYSAAAARRREEDYRKSGTVTSSASAGVRGGVPVPSPGRCGRAGQGAGPRPSPSSLQHLWTLRTGPGPRARGHAHARGREEEPGRRARRGPAARPNAFIRRGATITHGRTMHIKTSSRISSLPLPAQARPRQYRQGGPVCAANAPHARVLGLRYAVGSQISGFLTLVDGENALTNVVALSE